MSNSSPLEITDVNSLHRASRKCKTVTASSRNGPSVTSPLPETRYPGWPWLYHKNHPSAFHHASSQFVSQSMLMKNLIQRIINISSCSLDSIQKTSRKKQNNCVFMDASHFGESHFSKTRKMRCLLALCLMCWRSHAWKKFHLCSPKTIFHDVMCRPSTTIKLNQAIMAGEEDERRWRESRVAQLQAGC
jgi:hypothetical protein